MSNPIVPNYVPGVGRLVTDRFDFQNHIDGYSFRHVADQIDLSPVLVVDGYTVTNVQEAITTINGALLPPVIPDATTTEKGIVQLNGDVSGSATNLTVVGLQNYPVSNILPNDGESLTWVQANSQWEPVTINSFTAAGDLNGTSTNQNVVGLTGASGNVNISASDLIFDTNVVNPTIRQNVAISNGNDLKIIAQDGGNNSSGGDVRISGGAKNGSGLGGGVLLYTDDANPLVQLKNLSSNRKVVSLVNDQIVNNTQVPSGDRVIYIRDAATNPSSSPINGSILYSSGGKLNIKQSDGTDFVIGSIPNPSVWGSTNQQVITYKDYVSSIAGVATIARIYYAAPNTSVKLDVIYLGKGDVTDAHYSQNGSYSYLINNLGQPTTPVGGPWLSNKTSLNGTVWSNPVFDFTLSGAIRVKTPYSSTDVINWLIITQVTIVG